MAGARGALHVYLGSAPGAGKSCALLDEGHRLLANGVDVVIGVVDGRGRARTLARAEGLPGLAEPHPVGGPDVPEIEPERAGAERPGLDLDAILARRPQTVLVDDLAHRNAEGARHASRWQDVEALRDAGIDVVATVDVRELAACADAVEGVLGVRPPESVPEAVLRGADRIELVDAAPETLRARLSRGELCPDGVADARTEVLFRPATLARLRELALSWLAGHVGERAREPAASAGAVEERVLVVLTGGSEDEPLIRRAARLAARGPGDLLGVHVRLLDGSTVGRPVSLDGQRLLLTGLGGTLTEISAADAAGALVDFAAAEHVTQIVLARGRRGSLRSFTHGLLVRDVIRGVRNVDVHVVAVGGAPPRLPAVPPRRGPIEVSAPRRRAAWLLGTLGVAALAAALSPLHDSLGFSGALLFLLLAVTTVARLGGLRPAAAATVVGTLSADFFLTAPHYSLFISDPVEVLSVAVFFAVAGIISVLIDRLAGRGLEVARARAEAEALARLAGDSVVAGPHSLGDLAVQLRRTFDMDCVAVLAPADSGWSALASSGSPVPARPEDARYSAALDQEAVLVLGGRPLSADDTVLLGPFVSQMRLAQERYRLQGQARRAAELAEVDALRTALLDAVSHDLRTPLAGIKAAVSGLLAPDATWSARSARRFHVTIDRETDRLTALISNLLDISRLRAGTLPLVMRDTDVEKVLCRATDTLVEGGAPVDLDLPDDLPPVHADAGLLERALANVMANAQAVSPPGALVTVQAAAVGDRVEIRVVDAGPGVPEARRELVFQPFQRLGDSAGGGSSQGLGLGLAIARGFTEAMGGRLTVQDAPGAGAAFVFDLARAEHGDHRDRGDHRDHG